MPQLITKAICILFALSMVPKLSFSQPRKSNIKQGNLFGTNTIIINSYSTPFKNGGGKLNLEFQRILKVADSEAQKGNEQTYMTILENFRDKCANAERPDKKMLAEISLLLAKNDYSYDRLVKARAELEKAIAWNPDNLVYQAFLSEILLRQERYDESLEILMNSLARTAADSLKLEFNYRIAVVLNAKGNFAQALTYGLRSANFLEKAYPNKPQLKSQLYQFIALQYEELDSIQHSTEYFRDAIKFGLLGSIDSINLGQTYSNFALVQSKKGELDSAYKYFKLALKYLANYDEIAPVYQNIGQLFSVDNRYTKDSSEKYYQLAISSAKSGNVELKNLKLSQIYEDIARGHSNQQNWQQALVYYKLSENTLNEIDEIAYYDNIIRTYYAISETYSMMHNYNEAINYCAKGIRHCERDKRNEEYLKAFYGRIALFYILTKQNTDAFLCLNKTDFVKLPVKQQVLRFNELGDYYHNSGDCRSSILFYLLALDLISEHKLTRDKLYYSTNFKLAVAHYTLGNGKEAERCFDICRSSNEYSDGESTDDFILTEKQIKASNLFNTCTGDY